MVGYRNCIFDIACIDLPPITLPVFIEKSPFKNHVACLSL